MTAKYFKDFVEPGQQHMFFDEKKLKIVSSSLLIGIVAPMFFLNVLSLVLSRLLGWFQVRTSHGQGQGFVNDLKKAGFDYRFGYYGGGEWTRCYK
eukprot:15344854-Ditylum_brightwellii.AAC.1